MIEVPTRRGLLLGLGALLAAPAIVKISSLMPISAPKIYPIFFDLESWPSPLIFYGDMSVEALHLKAGGLNYITATEIRTLEEQAIKRLSNVLIPINDAFDNLALKAFNPISLHRGD